ncbi:hypothetical protein NC651_023782 [Populus alba x Populus x berolinensis]|nr:hypothetical protein NC651_023782 [Populus alba x Populus x berolinensis]
MRMRQSHQALAKHVQEAIYESQESFSLYVSFAVDGILLLDALSIVKALLEKQASAKAKAKAKPRLHNQAYHAKFGE